MFKATKFHCFLAPVCTTTQQKPTINNIGSSVHCPAIRNPAPK